MSWKLKLGLFALTGGGLVVGAAAVLKTMYIRVIQVTDDITCTFNHFRLSADKLTYHVLAHRGLRRSCHLAVVRSCEPSPAAKQLVDTFPVQR